MLPFLLRTFAQGQIDHKVFVIFGGRVVAGKATRDLDQILPVLEDVLRRNVILMNVFKASAISANPFLWSSHRCLNEST
jgi:hypothetical protein